MVIQTESLSRKYTLGSEEVWALRDLTLTVPRGSFLAIIGRSGSGKSTLLNILGGLDRPTAGRVVVDGHDLASLSSDEAAAYRREKVGFVFQSFNLIPTMTALQNVMLPLMLAGVGRAERELRARTLLEQVGLGARAAHPPTALSGGEQQRVAIARALANRPAILLADEPTGNLDSTTAAAILGLLRTLNGADGQTVVWITHEADLAREYSTAQVRLADGRVLESTLAPAVPPAVPPPASPPGTGGPP